MIFKVDLEYIVGYEEECYVVYSKPFKLWPSWTYISSCVGKEALLKCLRYIQFNPLYEGTINQISTQVKA